MNMIKLTEIHKEYLLGLNNDTNAEILDILNQLVDPKKVNSYFFKVENIKISKSLKN